MINSKKTLLGGMDSDSAPQLIDEDAYLNLMNARVTNATQTGRGLRAENIPGSTEISQQVYPPYGVSFPIGSGIDKVRGWLVYFAYNTFNDFGIYAYDAANGITYAVLYDSQVVGGLGFTKEYRIDRNVRIVGDLLYWTDNNNEPKRINYIKAIKANQADFDTDQTPYSFPMVYPTQTIIRRPPYYVLGVTKDNDSDFENNYIDGLAFQMAYFYEYVDFEWSKLSGWSDLLPYGPTEGSTYNFVRAKLTFDEPIDDDVQKVFIVVRQLGQNEVVQSNAYVRVFDKADATDAALIYEHNAGNTQLEFDYYANEAPTEIDANQANIPYDAVPLKSKTLETGKQRLFLGNNLMGYNTPLITSLTATSVTVDTDDPGGTFVGVWGYVTLHANWSGGGTCQDDYSYPFVYVTGGAPTGGNEFFYYPQYRINTIWNGGIYPADLPADVNLADAQFGSTTESNFVSNLQYFVYPSTSGCSVGFPTWQVTYEVSYTYFGSPIAVDVVQFTPSSVANFFKSNSTYNVSIVFFDRFRRKSGVCKNYAQVTIPQRTYTQTVFTTSIQWLLDNTNAANEIPDWAYYYSIVVTKNLTTRFFVQGQVNNGGYASKDNDGVITYHTDYDIETQYATAFALTPLYGLGLGYSFTEGDRITVFMEDGTTKDNIQVLGQDGNNVLFQLTDVGTIPADGTFIASYELFTPYLPTSSEPYYETGPVYAVLNPTTADRAYSNTSDVLIGDTYNIERTLAAEIFIAETMSPNDRYWQNWQTSTGWANFITNLGQKRLENQIKWSETYIPDTQVNGLSTFDALNATQTPQECGAIQKLQSATKVTEQGSVMLAIHTNETCSVYLGEVQVVDAGGATPYFASSNGVIGTINILKGDYGTVNPESVIDFRGLVWWVDALNGKVIQYSTNGLFAISDFKMARFWQRYLQAYLDADTNNLDNINGFHHIGTCIDPFTNELLVTLPGLIYENYANILPSYSSVPEYATSIINRFDVYDQLAKTMSFDILGNRWRQNYEYMPDWMDYLQTDLYGYKNNCTLHLFNSNENAYNTWFGVEYPVRLCMSWNVKEAVSAIKDVYDLALETNASPDFSVLYATYPWVQISDLTSDNYNDPEGVFYASWFRDRLSPNCSGTPDERLYKGDIVKSNFPMIMLEFQQYTELFYLTFVNLGFQISKGTQSLNGK